MMTSSTRENAGVFATKFLTKSMIAVVFCIGSAVWAQAQDAQQNSTGETATTTTQTSVANTNPSRTTESQSKSGNQTVDTRRVEVLGNDGRYRPDSDTETETVRVDDNTTRTVVRIYTWDPNGQRKLAEATEAETRTSASGDARTERTTSNSDLNGKLQVARREVEDTKKTSPQTQETKTTVYVADGDGGFSPSEQTQELQKTGADKSVEVKKTTLRPDVNGGWLVKEVSEKATKEEEKSRTTEERVSRPDLNGNVTVISRTVGEETETPTGESSSTVETYSLDPPGVTRDGSLHLSRRVTTLQKKDSNADATEQQVDQLDPGNPSDPLRVNTRTRYTVLYSSSGAQQTKSVQAPDGSGTFKVVAVEKKKTDEAPPAATPSNNPQ
ncbi:MAG: hypothetical protein WCA38_06475 [Candidatus Acidiferrales bacterium]